MSEKNLNYWQQKLSKNLPVLEISTDKIRNSNYNCILGIETFIFSQELLQSLKNISRRCDDNLLSVLITSFSCLLHRYTAGEDIVIGSYIQKSDNSGFNTLAFRNYLSGDTLFSQLLDQVHQEVCLDLQHQDFSWKQLLEKLPLKDKNVFQVMLSLQDARSNITFPSDIEELNLDLSFVVVESEEGLKGTVVYNQELFEPQTIQRMIGHFENLLNSIVENPDYKVNELTILNETERHKILVEWNQTQLDYPSDKCIHQLFEEQVAKTPDAVAIIWKDQQLTYQQLDNRANQLANYLQTLGIKPDSKVGICIERCLEMVVGILGILKAGG
ncbi:MAG: condensation domain-containing protein, partial [Cyanobacteria bacterium J06621_15]